MLHTICGDSMDYGLRRIIYFLVIILLFSFLMQYLHIGDIVIWVFNILLPLILGFVIRFLTDPLFQRFSNKKRKIVCITLYSSILLGIVWLLYIWIPPVIEQCMYWYGHFDITDIRSNLHPVLRPIYDFLMKANVLDFLLDMAGGITESLSYWLTNFLLAFGISFYLVFDDVHITTWIGKRNFHYQKQTLSICKDVKEVTHAFIKATCIDFLFFFIGSYFVFRIIGLDYVWTIALFLALTNLIAYIGPYIGGIPVIIYGFFISSQVGYFCLIAIIILQLIESNFVQPLLFKSCMHTGPIALLIAISIFGDFFGIIGMIIAPLLLAYIMILKKTVENHK